MLALLLYTRLCSLPVVQRSCPDGEAELVEACTEVCGEVPVGASRCVENAPVCSRVSSRFDEV